MNAIYTDSVTEAVTRATLTVQTSSVFLLHGAHGSGKTTVSRIIAHEWENEHPDWKVHHFSCIRESNPANFSRAFLSDLKEEPVAKAASPWEFPDQIVEFFQDTPGSLIYIDGANYLGELCVEWLLQVHSRLRDAECPVGMAFTATPPYLALHAVTTSPASLGVVHLPKLTVDDVMYALSEWNPQRFKRLYDDFLAGKPAADKIAEAIFEETSGGNFQRLQSFYQSILVTSQKGLVSTKVVQEAINLRHGIEAQAQEELALKAA